MIPSQIPPSKGSGTINVSTEFCLNLCNITFCQWNLSDFSSFSCTEPQVTEGREHVIPFYIPNENLDSGNRTLG